MDQGYFGRLQGGHETCMARINPVYDNKG